MDSEKKPKRNPKVIGLGLMAAAGCFLTMGNVVVQFCHKKWAKNVSTFEVLLLRSIIQLFFISGFMIYGRVSIFGNTLKNLIVLIVMGIVEVAAIVFVYLALEKIPVGDATVIQFTAPIFTAAFSFLFLRKACGVLDTICGVVSFCGVIVMARPTIIFGHPKSPKAVSHNVHGVKPTYKAGNPQYLEGIGLAILGAVCLSLFFILNKVTGKKLDVTLTIFYPSVVGIIISPIFITVTHHTWFAWNAHVFGFIALVGFVSFVGLMFMAESLQLEDAGPAILIRNLDVVYAFLMQYILLKIKPDIMSIIGACIVLTSTSLIAINRTVFAKFEWCQKFQNMQGKEDEDRFPLLRSDDNLAKKKPFHSKDTL